MLLCERERVCVWRKRRRLKGATAAGGSRGVAVTSAALESSRLEGKREGGQKTEKKKKKKTYAALEMSSTWLHKATNKSKKS